MVVAVVVVDDGTCRKLLIEKEKNKKRKNTLCSRRVSSLETGWVTLLDTSRLWTCGGDCCCRWVYTLHLVA